MANNSETSSRAQKLLKFFHDATRGQRAIATPANARLFLEAIPYKQPPSVCVEILVSSSAGLEAVRNSVRADIGLESIKTFTLPFLAFLSDPDIKLLAEGELLRQIIDVIVKPATFWKALIKSFLDHLLPQESLQPLAWLVHEVISLPEDLGTDLLEDVYAVVKDEGFINAASADTRAIGYKIAKAVQLRSATIVSTLDVESPGGRHDNDFAEFRKIEIFPTSDEFLSTDRPYYRLADEVFSLDSEQRAGVHLDNQFRLLREDMLYELRENFQDALKKKRRRPALRLGQLVPVNLDVGDDKKTKKCSLSLACGRGLEVLEKVPPAARTSFLGDNKNLVKHQAFGALCREEVIYGFAFVDRNVAELVKSPPIVQLQFTDSRALSKCLVALRAFNEVEFIVVDTPVFAYQPVLEGLKDITELPLQQQLLDPTSTYTELENGPRMAALVSKLRSVTATEDVAISIDDTTSLDQSQRDSLLNALTAPLCVIQGPPGTGKSFIGSRIVKYFHKYTDQKFLLISYTNHALDQFLEELQDIGIPNEDMVRLGSKSTARTGSLLLSNQGASYRRSTACWAAIDKLKLERMSMQSELEHAWEDYAGFQVSFHSLMEYLEFAEDCERFSDAFSLPAEDTKWKKVGKKGKEIRPDYLFIRWISGRDAGFLTNRISDLTIWAIPAAERHNLHAKWTKAMFAERVEAIQNIAAKLNKNQERLEKARNEQKIEILNSKRIISCTTTAAAMYNELIRAARPDIVLVEEAGEILECHILTALTRTVKKLVLIGDHRQLRPKINNYTLSVEKGLGFDLNKSLFERLVLQGYPHTTLRKQHRMHPDISAFPRALTYPDLLDAPRTSDRQRIEGICDRVIFVHHEHPEVSIKALADRGDPTTSSKQNDFEAEMILKIVAYLSQQGYNTDRMAVLTPYLGQLRLLRDKLLEDNDPVLNDLDAHDLIRAGLLTQAAAKADRKPLRLSTIDNYQGEESDIIVASMTRSNSEGDIGFMSAPERLNVLLSRARCSIIMVGNMHTFTSSRKGNKTWTPFFKLLKDGGHLYDGLPVKCPRHPDKAAILREPTDFQKHCPDGGCTEPCNADLSCGVHKCPRMCHRVTDHSKSSCMVSIEQTCDRQHKVKVRCGKKDARCRECVREDLETERRLKRDLELERKRLDREEAYRQELAQIEDEIDFHRRKMRYVQEEQDQKAEIAAKRKSAKELSRQAKKMVDAKEAKAKASVPGNADQQTRTAGSTATGPSAEDWKWLKEHDGAESEAMDSLMEMIGLETVKQEFLSVKNKVDTLIQQNAQLASERFNCTMLGNPGTGKTTVARLYAKFLCSVGVIPGSCFEETTGSSLAHGGVSECKKLIDQVLNNGGGVLFIDEAYQLTSGNSPGGRAVLDYLLPEVENLRGKVVFVLAGYVKEMETVFAHNPGIPSRFPIEMKFADYSDEELLSILELNIFKRYGGNMKCEEGSSGLYCRIVSRRVGRGRGTPGFGNARAIENALSQVNRRQSNRLFRERRAGTAPDPLFLSKEDMIGPEPSNALAKSQAWSSLQALIGLKSVKTAVAALMDSVQQNYVRELEEQPPIEYSLNKVFLGSPGTGKTTVAKLYGGILVDLGLLSKAEVIVKNPSDFVGDALGTSEKLTKGILAAASGKVLVIDEAYGLYGGGNQGSTSDPYKTAVIDTIVAEVQSVPGDDRCVLLLGYHDQMEQMFQNVNPGLSRRFPLASAFVFDDFSNAELAQVLDLKLKNMGFSATDQAKKVAMEMLDRARNRPNFGNAGEIDILLNAAKAQHQSRISASKAKYTSIFEAVDFDANFDRADRSGTNIKKLFEDTVGSEDVVKLLEGYQETVRMARSLGLDPKENVPFNFLFRGPPGTGKTSTARKMGKVFYDMGFLATASVEDCSASDLVGQYVGQTGPKVRQLLDKALGKVLFVDEAYRLAGGNFAQEALDELTDSITKPQYAQKLVIILAGYEKDINQLMSMNPGLTSRFPEVVNFRQLTAVECVALLQQKFKARKTLLYQKSPNVSFDIASIESLSKDLREDLEQRFLTLSKQSNWASARDVGTIAKKIFNRSLKSQDKSTRQLAVSEIDVRAEIDAMVAERDSRGNFDGKFVTSDDPLVHAAHPLIANGSNYQMNTTTTVNTTDQETQPDNQPLPLRHHEQEHIRDPRDAQRDAGVSDEVWEQLQKDKQAQRDQEEAFQRLKEAKKTASGAARDKILKQLLEEEDRRKREEELQKKLAIMGVCPMGYQWIKQDSGYRCAGGSHFLSNDQLAGH